MKINEITTIKLGQKPNSDKAKAFVADFVDQSHDHPFNRRARIFNDTMIELSVDGAEVHLSDIQTMKPRSGAGTKAMKALVQLADKHGVRINAFAKAYANDEKFVSDTVELVKWYERLGFTVVDEEDDGYEIKYYPK